MKDGGASVWSRNIEFGFRHGKFGACTIPKCRCNTGRGDTGPELRFVRYLHRGGNGSFGNKLSHLKRACGIRKEAPGLSPEKG